MCSSDERIVDVVDFKLYVIICMKNVVGLALSKLSSLTALFQTEKNRPNPLNERTENDGQVGCREGYVDSSMNKIVLLSS